MGPTVSLGRLFLLPQQRAVEALLRARFGPLERSLFLLPQQRAIERLFRARFEPLVRSLFLLA